MVELFCVVAEIFKRNKELKFPGKLCVDTLIQEAIAMFKKVRPGGSKKGLFPLLT